MRVAVFGYRRPAGRYLGIIADKAFGVNFMFHFQEIGKTVQVVEVFQKRKIESVLDVRVFFAHGKGDGQVYGELFIAYGGHLKIPRPAKTVREGKLAATRGYTCSYARVQKGYGVGGSKQHRCFGKTTTYKWQNNAVVFWITGKSLHIVDPAKLVKSSLRIVRDRWSADTLSPES